MRNPLAVIALLLVPTIAPAQDLRAIDRAETILYLLKLHDRESGGFRPDPKGKPGLRATSAAVRALKYNDAELKPGAPIREKAAAFVMSCYDTKTGGYCTSYWRSRNVEETFRGVLARTYSLPSGSRA